MLVLFFGTDEQGCAVRPEEASAEGEDSAARKRPKKGARAGYALAKAEPYARGGGAEARSRLGKAHSRQREGVHLRVGETAECTRRGYDGAWSGEPTETRARVRWNSFQSPNRDSEAARGRSGPSRGISNTPSRRPTRSCGPKTRKSSPGSQQTSAVREKKKRWCEKKKDALV